MLTTNVADDMKKGAPLLALYVANKNYSSWSLRPWLLLRQLGIPFEEKLVPFGANAGEGGFRTFSPTGRVPCLVDGSLTVWDSLAIVEYIAEIEPSAWPRQAHARAWARAASAEMHSGFQNIRNTCTMNCGLRVQLIEATPALQEEWSRIDALWQQGMDRFGGPYLAGPQFTAVDAFFAPIAFRAQTYSPSISAAARAYADRLLKLPTMVEWYESALRETWRDEDHEHEARVAGVWLEDFRVGSKAPG